MSEILIRVVVDPEISPSTGLRGTVSSRPTVLRLLRVGLPLALLFLSGQTYIRLHIGVAAIVQ